MTTMSSSSVSSFSSALVTGASQGLGRALVLALARRGVAVALVARRRAPLLAVVEEVRALGVRAVAIEADVTGDAARIVGRATAAIGPIDLMVHNASTLGPTPLGPMLDLSGDELARVIDVNLLAPFRLSQLVAGHMALQGQGTLVHISSDAAVEAYPGWGPYSVAKAGLDHMSRLWAAELGAHGVRSLAIDPGEMDTAMHRAALPDADPATLQRPEVVAERLLASLPMLDNGARVSLPSLPNSRSAA